ncbi:MAG: hypothetical protein IJI97_05895 [Clostridia bacterium]|nr:hypothetical protein [Clostridia bacterium]
MKVKTFRNAILAAVMLMFVVVAGMVAVSADAEARPGISLSHPCDINANGRKDGSTERRCLRVWEQDAYTTTVQGGYTETPAGPTVVNELINEWRLEFRGELTSRASLRYLDTGLRDIQADYANRDR